MGSVERRVPRSDDENKVLIIVLLPFHLTVLLLQADGDRVTGNNE